MRLDLDHLHRVHCVGIGGIGVSAVAKLLRLQGKEVTGSDPVRSVVTEDAERAGVAVRDPSADNVQPDLDLLIHTSAAPETQVEREAAAKFGIPQMSYFEFLGLLSAHHKTIAVAGTNGKSTTTAMLALILERAGLDPLVIVGSRVPGFPYGNLRIPVSSQQPTVNGQPSDARRLFVVEACEYRAQFLQLAPSVVVTTKIVEDHLDYYRDLAHIQATFREFVAKLPPDGLSIRNADDVGSREAYAGLAQAGGTFGFSKDADVRAERHATAEGLQTFDAVFKDGASWRGLELRVPGAFNVSNALAAVAAARALGAGEEAVRAALADFRGIWRRFEKVGEREGMPVVSDYGHTPDAIEATLKAAREFYPGRKIIVVFQPHQHDRTRRLFEAFTAAFDGADDLVLAEIYGVEGRKEGEKSISSRDLAEAVRSHGKVGSVSYAADLDEARRQAEALASKDAMMLVMGAGDIYLIAEDLCRTTR